MNKSPSHYAIRSLITSSAADYGSPQRRERVIFWAARRSEMLPKYPLPTHVAPQFRAHVLSLPTLDKLNPVERSDQNCAPFRALVVADAISDLVGSPAIMRFTTHLASYASRGLTGRTHILYALKVIRMLQRRCGDTNNT